MRKNKSFQIISGWGNYPRQSVYVSVVENEKDIDAALQQEKLSVLAHGLGRSYGDNALNQDNLILKTTSFNRFITFDIQKGFIECEAGASLEGITHVCLPKGWFLPVTPGTKYVTLGGAIANDVHGKNHHVDGCFSEFVEEIRLMISTGEVIRCSRNENTDIFYATIGGMGLTGFILSAVIRLIPVETAYVNVHYQKTKNLNETLDLFLSEDRNHKYSVAWIDCLAKGDALGRSVVMYGDHAKAADVNKSKPLEIKPKRKLVVPFYAPSFLLNRYTIGLFNEVYYRIQPKKKTKLVDYDSYFYPLDSILHWNRLYGKKGFLQYQTVFPRETSREGLKKMLELLSSSGKSSFLAVLKSTGKQNNGYLSFPFEGHTLALDIPVSTGVFELIKKLDEIVLQHNGRIYLAKDAVVSKETFEAMYPKDRIKSFNEVVGKVNPKGTFSSSMARRIGLLD